MNKIFGIIKRPMPMWLLVPFIFMMAAPLLAGPPIWYGGLNLDGGTIVDPSAPPNTCVGVNGAGQYVYGSNCASATPVPISIPTPVTWADTTTGTTNTQLASLTTTSGVSNGSQGAWILFVYASSQGLTTFTNDQQFFCVYANKSATNAAGTGDTANTCGVVATFSTIAWNQVFQGAGSGSELVGAATVVWQGQYANNTTVTLRVYGVNTASASGAVGRGALQVHWIPI